jgi:hypothetical protein
LAVKTKFKSKFVDIKLPDADSPRPVNLVCVKITSGFSVFYIFVVYFPSSISAEQFNLNLNYISSLSFMSDSVVYFIGDFNVPDFSSAETESLGGKSFFMNNFIHFLQRKQYNSFSKSHGLILI